MEGVDWIHQDRDSNEHSDVPFGSVKCWEYGIMYLFLYY